MRIASFNVENLSDAPDADTPVSARLEVLRPQFARLAADIVCLQEVDATKDPDGGGRRLTALDTLLSETRYRDFHIANTVHPNTGAPANRHNLVVLSRWPIVRSAQYLNDFVAPPAYRCATAEPAEANAGPVGWDRPILHAEIELPGGRRVHVINTHLKAPSAAHVPGQKSAPYVWNTVSGWAEGYFLAVIKRAGQALETRMLVDRLFDADPAALIALAGDFNAEAHEPPLDMVAGDVEDTGNGRLASRSLVLLEHTLPPSRRFTVIHRGRRQMLDHLLVSRPLLAHYRGIEIHNEALGDELVAYTLVDAAPDSYHAPIVAQFEMG